MPIIDIGDPQLGMSGQGWVDPLEEVDEELKALEDQERDDALSGALGSLIKNVYAGRERGLAERKALLKKQAEQAGLDLLAARLEGLKLGDNVTEAVTTFGASLDGAKDSEGGPLSDGSKTHLMNRFAIRANSRLSSLGESARVTGNQLAIANFEYQMTATVSNLLADATDVGAIDKAVTKAVGDHFAAHPDYTDNEKAQIRNAVVRVRGSGAASIKKRDSVQAHLDRGLEVKTHLEPMQTSLGETLLTGDIKTIMALEAAGSESIYADWIKKLNEPNGLFEQWKKAGVPEALMKEHRADVRREAQRFYAVFSKLRTEHWDDLVNTAFAIDIKKFFDLERLAYSSTSIHQYHERRSALEKFASGSSWAGAESTGENIGKSASKRRLTGQATLDEGLDAMDKVVLGRIKNTTWTSYLERRLTSTVLDNLGAFVDPATGNVLSFDDFEKKIRGFSVSIIPLDAYSPDKYDASKNKASTGGWMLEHMGEGHARTVYDLASRKVFEYSGGVKDILDGRRRAEVSIGAIRDGVNVIGMAGAPVAVPPGALEQESWKSPVPGGWDEEERGKQWSTLATEAEMESTYRQNFNIALTRSNPNLPTPLTVESDAFTQMKDMTVSIAQNVDGKPGRTTRAVTKTFDNKYLATIKSRTRAMAYNGVVTQTDMREQLERQFLAKQEWDSAMQKVSPDLVATTHKEFVEDNMVAFDAVQKKNFEEIFTAIDGGKFKVGSPDFVGEAEKEVFTLLALKGLPREVFLSAWDNQTLPGQNYRTLQVYSNDAVFLDHLTAPERDDLIEAMALAKARRLAVGLLYDSTTRNTGVAELIDKNPQLAPMYNYWEGLVSQKVSVADFEEDFIEISDDDLTIYDESSSQFARFPEGSITPNRLMELIGDPRESRSAEMAMPFGDEKGYGEVGENNSLLIRTTSMWGDLIANQSGSEEANKFSSSVTQPYSAVWQDLYRKYPGLKRGKPADTPMTPDDAQRYLMVDAFRTGLQDAVDRHVRPLWDITGGVTKKGYSVGAVRALLEAPMKASGIGTAIGPRPAADSAMDFLAYAVGSADDNPTSIFETYSGAVDTEDTAIPEKAEGRIDYALNYILTQVNSEAIVGLVPGVGPYGVPKDRPERAVGEGGFGNMRARRAAMKSYLLEEFDRIETMGQMDAGRMGQLVDFIRNDFASPIRDSTLNMRLRSELGDDGVTQVIQNVQNLIFTARGDETTTIGGVVIPLVPSPGRNNNNGRDSFTGTGVDQVGLDVVIHDLVEDHNLAEGRWFPVVDHKMANDEYIRIDFHEEATKRGLTAPEDLMKWSIPADGSTDKSKIQANMVSQVAEEVFASKSVALNRRPDWKTNLWAGADGNIKIPENPAHDVGFLGGMNKVLTDLDRVGTQTLSTEGSQYTIAALAKEGGFEDSVPNILNALSGIPGSGKYGDPEIYWGTDMIYWGNMNHVAAAQDRFNPDHKDVDVMYDLTFMARDLLENPALMRPEFETVIAQNIWNPVWTGLENLRTMTSQQWDTAKMENIGQMASAGAGVGFGVGLKGAAVGPLGLAIGTGSGTAIGGASGLTLGWLEGMVKGTDGYGSWWFGEENITKAEAVWAFQVYTSASYMAAVLAQDAEMVPIAGGGGSSLEMNHALSRDYGKIQELAEAARKMLFQFGNVGGKKVIGD